MSYTQRMSTLKSRRDQFSEATRAALLDAATKRFGELGFAGTSLEDVAADIQATRGAVYHHFSSKRALFEAVLEKLETEAMVQAEAAGDAGDNAWHSALLALDSFLDRCTEPIYGRIVWQEGPIALGWARWEELEQEFAYGLVEQYVRALIDGGFIPPPALPVETTAKVAFGLLGTAGKALAEAPREDKARLRAEYGTVITRLLAGLATG
jgi:AcrR family transcriptional regulator